MKRTWGYLKYLIVHKWLVFLACWHLGIKWLGVIHDLNKFKPGNFADYAWTFFDQDGNPYEKPGIEGNLRFKRAWKDHQENSCHHWQYWILDGEPVPMPSEYTREMVADWTAMSRQRGKPHASEWYQSQKGKIKIHRDTRELAERLLAEIKRTIEFKQVVSR